MAFGLATQQSHALGKTPKGYGTAEGRKKAKKKYDEPGKLKKTPNPGNLKSEKLAFVDALPALTGLASGYGPGRSVAEETAAAIAPEGRVHRSANIARNAAVIGAPLGGLAAMALSKKYDLPGRIGNFVARKFPAGLIAEPAVEKELVNLGVPGVAAIVGSLGGGALTGGAVGGLQRLRGPVHQTRKGPDDEGYNAKMGSILVRLTKTAREQAGEKEDAETGDENEPQITKAADDGGVNGGFSTNQYSGVMNPPPMVYKSGIPPFQDPPVKTSGSGAPSEKSAGVLGEVEGQAARKPGLKIQLPGALVGLADDAYILARNYQRMHGEKEAAAGFTPQSQLNSSKAVGAPKLSTPPGPSIAQIAKPPGYGRPISGAAKGNHII